MRVGKHQACVSPPSMLFRCNGLVVTPSFQDVRSPSDACGMTLEKCYDWAKEQQEDVAGKMSRGMTDALVS